ncbi:MAG: xanthine phosphoribosyltransferase [Alphaproteobacteria bacterium]|nr:xanthine phosphoribosyltransferase [Rhodospirillales bacterium]MCW9044991.1 xanthine phosphoribosyltransferase [Alphaproteobacteria bacterium]
MEVVDPTAKALSVTWQEVHRDTRELARRLMKLGPWHGMIAITRGGLVPAAILARELNIRLIDTLCVSSYTSTDGAETGQGELSVLKPVIAASEDNEGEGWLVIDDLVDTGATAKKAREMLPKAHIATIYAKPKGRPLADTVIGEVPQDVWIYFPWDTEPQFIRPISEIE